MRRNKKLTNIKKVNKVLEEVVDKLFGYGSHACVGKLTIDYDGIKPDSYTYKVIYGYYKDPMNPLSPDFFNREAPKSYLDSVIITCDTCISLDTFAYIFSGKILEKEK